MLFRNLKTGNLLHTANKDVIEVMASSPIYEKVISAVATAPPPVPEAAETGNKGKKKAVAKAT